METKELMEKFLAENDVPSNYSIKSMYRAEIPELEKKFGKQFIYFNKQELTEAFSTFKNNRGNNEDKARIATFTISFIASMYRRLWSWYIENIEVIADPWTSREMSGSTFLSNVESFNSEAYDPNLIEDTIQKVRRSNLDGYADLIELVIRLIYDGVETTQEILQIKEENIDFTRQTISINGKIVRLEKRTFDLLVKNHNTSSIEGGKHDFCMASWRGSYFRKPSYKDNLDEYSLQEQGNVLNRYFNTYVRKPLGVDLTARRVYVYGFIRYCLKFMELDKLRATAKGEATPEDNKRLYELAVQYGMAAESVSYVHIQRRLRKYL